MDTASKAVVKPSVWNLVERHVAPLWVNDDQEAVILAKIQREEAEERKAAQAKPLYQIGNMTDVCQKLMSMHVEATMDQHVTAAKSAAKPEPEEQQQDTGLKKLIFVEMEEYPGYSDEPCPLPQKVETPTILRLVSRAIKITEKPGLIRDWRDFFYSQENEDILHDLFWWFFLKKFQKPPQESPSFVYDRELKEKTSLLFARVARTYTSLLNRTFRYTNREKLLLHYPNAVSQAIYSAYCHAFPVSWRRYNTEFKHDLLETVSIWMTGTRPMVRHWANWDYSSLEPPNMRKDCIDKDANAQKQKVKDKSSMENILTFPSTFSSATTGKSSPSPRRPPDHSHTSLSSSHQSKGPTNDRKGGVSNKGSDSPTGRGHSTSRHVAGAAKTRDAIESHSSEPGPEFVLTKFNLSGHCPLVEYYLRESKLARDAGTAKLVSRKEILSYPSEGETYKQIITRSRKKVKAITKDMNTYWNECHRAHVKTMNDNFADRLEFQKKSAKLLENHTVVGKLAEMIVNDRLHNQAGANTKIAATIDSLIAKKDETDDKA